MLGSIGMPELIAERVEAAVVVARPELVPGIEVGNVGELGVLQALLDPVVAGRLDAAKQATDDVTSIQDSLG